MLSFQGKPVDFVSCGTADEIAENATKLITFIDLAGHQVRFPTTGKCKTTYWHSHRRQSEGGVEIVIFKSRDQDTFMGRLELDIDYVYFQPPHMAIMPMSNPLIRQLCLFQNLVFWMKKNAMKILIYDYIHMCWSYLNIVGKCITTYGISHRGTRQGDEHINIFVILGEQSLSYTFWISYSYTSKSSLSYTRIYDS